MPGLPLAIVPHPLGGIGEKEVLTKVDAAAEAVVKALCAAAPAEKAEARR